MAQKLKVNDVVKVIAGDHKGETAKIIGIDREAGRAFLEGVSERERHMRKSYLNPMGGKKTVHQGINLSNLKLEKASVYEKPKKDEKGSEKTEKSGKRGRRSKAEKADKGEKGAK